VGGGFVVLFVQFSAKLKSWQWKERRLKYFGKFEEILIEVFQKFSDENFQFEASKLSFE
jgi:hypothetical protein